MPQGDGQFPTILHIGGYDGTAEENFASADAALDRGWAFITLDGNGTGKPLYERRKRMRNDWEHVVHGMVDLVLRQHSVDPDGSCWLVDRSVGCSHRGAHRVSDGWRR